MQPVSREKRWAIGVWHVACAVVRMHSQYLAVTTQAPQDGYWAGHCLNDTVKQILALGKRHLDEG